MWVQSLGQEGMATLRLKGGMATLSRIVAQRIPLTEWPGVLQSKGHKESDTNEQWASNSLYFCGLSVIFFSFGFRFYIFEFSFFWWVWPKVYQFCLSFQSTDLCFICFYCLLVSSLSFSSNPFFLTTYFVVVFISSSSFFLLKFF